MIKSYSEFTSKEVNEDASSFEKEFKNKINEIVVFLDKNQKVHKNYTDEGDFNNLKHYVLNILELDELKHITDDIEFKDEDI